VNLRDALAHNLIAMFIKPICKRIMTAFLTSTSNFDEINKAGIVHFKGGTDNVNVNFTTVQRIPEKGKKTLRTKR
jgi:hypothetical protein